MGAKLREIQVRALEIQCQRWLENVAIDMLETAAANGEGSWTLDVPLELDWHFTAWLEKNEVRWERLPTVDNLTPYKIMWEPL